MRARPLTSAQVEAITRPGTWRVDAQLYLQVRDHGTRSWLFRYQRGGRPRWMGLGPVELVPIAEARKKALECRVQLLNGVDPFEAREAERPAPQPGPARKPSVPTFATCAEQYIAAHEAGWKNDKHRAQWVSTIRSYANPVIGKLAVSEVAVGHIVSILQRDDLWTAKPETAGRLRGRLERILDWARAMGHREGTNPARWKGSLSHLLPPLNKVQRIKHHAAIPYADLPALVAELSARHGTSAEALLFLILTAARTGEVIGATWGEVNLDDAVWVVPSARMKSGRPHRVPLSDGAVALLRALPARKGLLFPGARPGKPLSSMAMLELLRGLRGHGVTVHGLRSSFRDWAAECTGYPREVAEAALAHVVGDRTEAAYLRTAFFDQRRRLMADWASFCGLG